MVNSMKNLRFALSEYKQSLFIAIIITLQVAVLFMVNAVCMLYYDLEMEKRPPPAAKQYALQNNDAQHLVLSTSDAVSLKAEHHHKMNAITATFFNSHPGTYALVEADGNLLPLNPAKDLQTAESILIIGDASAYHKDLTFKASGDRCGKYIPSYMNKVGMGTEARVGGSAGLKSVVTGNAPTGLIKTTYLSSTKFMSKQLEELPIYVLSFEQYAQIKDDATMLLASKLSANASGVAVTEYANQIALASEGRVTLYPIKNEALASLAHNSVFALSLFLFLTMFAIGALGLSTASFLTLSLMRNLRSNAVHWLYGATKADLQKRIAILAGLFILPGFLIGLFYIKRFLEVDKMNHTNIFVATGVVLALLYLVAIIRPILVIKRLKPMQVLRTND